MKFSQIAEAYWKFSWIYARIILYGMAGFLILWLVVWLYGFLFMAYDIIVLGRNRYPVVALPAMIVGLLFAVGSLWLVRWAIRKSRGGVTSPLAIKSRAIASSRRFRVFIAFVAGMSAAQLAAIAAMVVHGAFDSALSGPELRTELAFVGMMTVPLSGFAAIGATLLIALPLYVIFRRFVWVSLGHYIVAGVAVSVLGFAGYLAMQAFGISARFWDLNLPTVAVLVLLAGPIATTVFWLIARPDRVPTIGPTQAGR